MALGKVASYIKNLGKSAAYATIHEFEESMPAVSGYKEANAAVAKEIYHAVTDFKGTVKRVKQAFTSSKVYEVATETFSNALEDLSTGNWYNQERETAIQNKLVDDFGGGEDFDSMFSDLDKMFEGDDFKNLDPGDKVVVKSIEGTAKASANTIANATITSAKYQSEVAKINNNVLFAQQERWFGQLHSGISTMNDNVNTINKFNMDVFQKHIENSTTFFKAVTDNTHELNTMFKEFLTMYRNEYKVRDKAMQANEKALAAKKHNDDEPLTYNALVNVDGSVNFGTYLQHIKNQFNKHVIEDIPLGMVMLGKNAMVKDGGMIKAFTSNPLGLIMESAIKGIIGPGLKQSMDYFNTILSGAFGTAMARLNTWATNPDYDDSFGGKAKEWIGKLLGTADLKSTYSQQLDTSKYAKGAIPFDGITKKAIVDVIPELLGDILAEISNGEHRRFDYMNGQWTTLEDLVKRDAIERKASEREARSLFDHVIYNSENLNLLSSHEYNQRELLEQYEKYFIPYLQSRRNSPHELYKLASIKNKEKADELAFKMFGTSGNLGQLQHLANFLINNVSKEQIMLAPGDYQDKIGRLNAKKKGENAETGVNNSRYVENGIKNVLAENSYIRDNKTGNLYYTTANKAVFDRNGNRQFSTKQRLASEVDNLGNNIFTYLQNIDANISGLYSTATNFVLDYGGQGVRGIDISNNMISNQNSPLNQFRAISKVKPKYLNLNRVKNLKPILAKKKIFESIFEYDLPVLDFSNINAQNIDNIIKEKQYRLACLEKLNTSDMMALQQYIPSFDVQSTILKIYEDINQLQMKRKYIVGTTRSSGAVGNSILGNNRKIIQSTSAYWEKQYDEDFNNRLIEGAKAASTVNFDANHIIELFDKVLEANGEKEGDDGFTASQSNDNISFHRAIDKTIGELGDLGLDLDSPEAKMIVGILAERWKMHYGIHDWIDADYGKQNTVYKFTRAINAENSLRNRLKAKNKDFDWGEFEKKSFADKISSVDSLGEKWDVIMMQVGKMVEAPAKMMSDVFRSAGDSIFDFFYNDDVEYIDKDGKPIKGFFGLLEAKAVNSLDSIVTGFDKNIWEPIKKQFGFEAQSLSDALGISWLTEKYGKATKHAFAQLSDNINDFLFSGGLEKVEKSLAKDKDEKTENDKDKTSENEIDAAASKKKDELFRDKLVELLKNEGEDEENQTSNAKGARIINKSGLTAISKGEMIIPSEQNPFYIGKTNKQAEIKNEKKIKNGLGKYVANMIGMNAEGSISIASTSDAPTSVESYVGILNHLKVANPKVYDEVMDIVTNQAGNTVTKENAAQKVMALLTAHKNDRTPEEEQRYQRVIEAKAEGSFVKRILNSAQSSMTKMVLNTKNDTVRSIWDDLTKNDSQAVGNGIAGGTLGAVAGLITGLGPLAGMVVGAGANIIIGSESIKETLFGAKDDKGNRSGGSLLSASEYKYLSKLIPDIGKFGLIGAGTGLVGIAPFGILGGLGIGTMAAFARQNSSFMETLFGDVDGIIDKDKQEFLKKAMPNMALGTVAAYALGPFGILGSMILGSAGGMVATSEKFKSIFLGDKRFDGTRSGGILGELKDHFVSPLANFAAEYTSKMASFVYQDIITPFAQGVGPIVRLTGLTVKNIGKTLLDGVKKLTIDGGWFKDVWSSMVTPLIDKVGKVGKGAISKATNFAKPIISAPFKFVRRLGEKSNQIMLNRGDSAGMSAEERLAYVNSHAKDFPLFGKGNEYRDNDIRMLEMNDDDLVEAENLARYIKSNGEGTEKALIANKDKLRANLRGLLGVKSLTGAQDKLIEKLLSSDSEDQKSSNEELTSLLVKNHITDKNVLEAFGTTVDVMRKQKSNLDQIKSSGMDAAKKRFADLGFKGDPVKVLSLLSQEVKGRNIFGKLEEASEMSMVDKQVSATEQTGDKIVTATQEGATQITTAIESLSDEIAYTSDKFEEYLRNPEKFKKETNDYNKKLEELNEKINISITSGVDDASKYIKEREDLIHNKKLRDWMSVNTDYFSTDSESLIKNVDAIMTSGDDHYFSSRDVTKLHKNSKNKNLASNIDIVKKNNLWTDSFNILMNLKEDQYPIIDTVGTLYKKYGGENGVRWSLIDALSFSKDKLAKVDNLMGSGMLPTRLGWYVDHKSNLNDFERAIKSYKDMDNSSNITDATARSRLGILKDAINKAQGEKVNAKDSHRILNAAEYRANVSRLQQLNPSVNDRSEKDYVTTTTADGKELHYYRSTDGSLVAADTDTRKYLQEREQAKKTGELVGLDKFFGNKEANGSDFLSRKWADAKHTGKSVGNAISKTGGLLSTILGPIFGFGGKVALGAVAGGLLLKQIPGLSNFVTTMITETGKFIIKTGVSVLSYTIEHAGDIAHAVWEVIRDGFVGIASVVFGLDKTDEELEKEGIIIDKETGKYYKDAKAKATGEAMTQKEIEAARARKSVIGAIGDIYSNAWDKMGTGEKIITGGATAAGTVWGGIKAWQKIKNIKGYMSDWGGRIKDSYNEAKGGWRGVLKAGGQLFNGKVHSNDPIQSQVESIDENTIATNNLSDKMDMLAMRLDGNSMFGGNITNDSINTGGSDSSKKGKKRKQNRQSKTGNAYNPNKANNKMPKRSKQMKTAGKIGKFGKIAAITSGVSTAAAIGASAASGNPVSTSRIDINPNTPIINNPGNITNTPSKPGFFQRTKDWIVDKAKKSGAYIKGAVDFGKNNIKTAADTGKGIIEKVMGWLNKVPVIKEHLGPKITKVMPVIKGALTKFAGKIGARMASFSIPGFGQMMMIGFAAYGFYNGFSNAAEILSRVQLQEASDKASELAGSGKFGRGDDQTEMKIKPPSFLGKCICGILGAIEGLIGIPPELLLPYIPERLLYSDDTETTENTQTTGAGKFGRGYFKQTDPRYAGMRFNAKGDSKYQTIGDSGCGPIAAVNALYGTGPDPIEASNFALKHGYKEIDGGTKPDFFKDYFKENGKDSEYTTSSSSILKNLAAGNKVVLEGQSNKIDKDTPFGRGPHYVTATGLDKNGNMIIQDPQDNRSDIPFDANKVLSKTKFGVVAKGKCKYRRGSITDLAKATGSAAFAGAKILYQGAKHLGKKILGSDTPLDRAFAFFRHKGFSTAAAAGILGNLMQESSIDPAVHEGYKDLGNKPVGGAGKYGRGEDSGNILVDIVNSVMGDLGFGSNASKNNNRAAQTINNHVDESKIRAALDWANNRVGKIGEGNNGCTAFVNQFLAKADNPQNGWSWVPNIVTDAKANNIWKDANAPAKAGDIAVLETNNNSNDGADHVVIATGDGDYIGNSSSRNKIWRGNLGRDFGAKNIVGYVETGIPSDKGTVTTEKLARSQSELIKDSGTSALPTGKGKYGRGKDQLSVHDFVYGTGDNDIDESVVDRQIKQDMSKIQRQLDDSKKLNNNAELNNNLLDKISENTAKDYSEEFKQIIALLVQIATGIKNSSLSKSNTTEMEKLKKRVNSLMNRNSGVGKVNPDLSLDGLDDMLSKLYAIAQR